MNKRLTAVVLWRLAVLALVLWGCTTDGANAPPAPPAPEPPLHASGIPQNFSGDLSGTPTKQTVVQATGAGSNGFGQPGTSLPIPATQTILAADSGVPVIAFAGGVTTTGVVDGGTVGAVWGVPPGTANNLVISVEGKNACPGSTDSYVCGITDLVTASIDGGAVAIGTASPSCGSTAYTGAGSGYPSPTIGLDASAADGAAGYLYVFVNGIADAGAGCSSGIEWSVVGQDQVR